MGSFKPPRAFNSQDLETIQWVYEFAWAQIVASEPLRDTKRDAERQAALRKWLFACASSTPIEFDVLYSKVLENLPEHRSYSAGYEG